MPDIDTVRPASTSFNINWGITGAATAHAATNDNSDASYIATIDASTCFVQLLCTSHTPAADHQRHLFRVRCRAQGPAGGNQVELFVEESPDVDGGSTFVTLSPAAGSVAEYSGPWTLLNPAGAIAAFTYLISATVDGSPTGLRLNELYVDIDNRLKPSFSADVLRGNGTSAAGGTIADTNRPRFEFDSLSYDGLTGRTWTVEVRTNPGGVLVFSAGGAGSPPAQVFSDPLPNGGYSADLQVLSTIRANDAFASDVENVTFTMGFIPPTPPVLTAAVIADPPSVDLDWVSGVAGSTVWDVNADVVTEIRRTDCNGTVSFYMERTGLAAATFIDRFMSLSDQGLLCGQADHICTIIYEARYWGEVTGGVVATDWIAAGIAGAVSPVHAAATEFATFTTTSPATVSHDPGAVARGIVVEIDHGTDSADLITAVTYGGVLMQRKITALDSAGEPGRSYLYFLGKGIPSGAQTVSITHTATATVKHATVASMTAPGDTQVVASGVDQADQSNPAVALDSGTALALRYGVIYSGLDAVASLTPTAGITAIHDHDFGTFVSRFDRQTSGGSGSFSLGYTAASDDVAMCAVAIASIISLTVDNPSPDNDWLRGVESGDRSACPARSYQLLRPFGVFQPIGGGMPTVVTGDPGGRNYSLRFTIKTRAELEALEAILKQQLFFYQAVTLADVWLTPNTVGVEVVKLNEVSILSASCVAVNPQPVASPESFFV